MRMLPFFKPKKGFQFAGGGLETSSGGGGGGGGGSTPIIPDNGEVKVFSIGSKDVYACHISNPRMDAYINDSWLMALNIGDILGCFATTSNGQMAGGSTFNIETIYFNNSGLYIDTSGSGWSIADIVIFYTKAN